MVKILVFGDSIGWGAFDIEKGGWVERLKIFYLKSFKQRGVSVYNCSISSDTSKGVLNRIESTVDNILKIENEEIIFLFSIGTNDAAYLNSKDNFEIPIEIFKENINKIIEKAKKYSNKILFTGFPKANEFKSMPWEDYTEGKIYWENSELKNYEDELKKICLNKNIPLIEIWDLLVNEDLPDGIHPNDLGHNKIYEKVKDYMEKYLQ